MKTNKSRQNKYKIIIEQQQQISHQQCKTNPYKTINNSSNHQEQNSMYEMLMDSPEIRQKLLASNPLLLPKLLELNKLKDNIELLQFVRIEQLIINQDMVKYKMPELATNIEAIQTKIQEKQEEIASKKVAIEDTLSNIEKMRGKLANKYQQNRQISKKTKVLQDQFQRLKQSRRTNKLQTNRSKNEQINSLIHRKLNKTSRPNNQNINLSNNELNNQNHSTELLKRINLSTNNKLLQQKICSMKEEIKNKMKKLEEVKKQKKSITEQISDQRSIANSRRRGGSNNSLISVGSSSKK